ncbi:hypothetical protein N7447_006031 [Penicillium robsamsonii]|uniref:uncharacterized protein n=1 Tax=Penicillium robsamsonii TaxID=1792511 RepID=UPI002546A70F|nr:uncharacterized protein N7447_006031 [Penicillium robsamsonii]KAJ5823691.1 hypothetical protein N7447_006031 [Penicillium robsamsonii]
MSTNPPPKPGASSQHESNRTLNMSAQNPNTQNTPSTPAMAPHQPIQIPSTPGSCALRLENLEQQTSTMKGELMASIAADICATFISIAKYSEEGTLQAKHTGVIDKVIQTIRDTDVKYRHLLDRQVRGLRKERKWIRKKYSRLAGQADGLGRTYQTKARKLTISLRETRGEVVRLQRERDLLRACVKKNETPNDNVDGEFEVDAGESDGEYEIAGRDETVNEVDI